jgi:hypothetical protein
MYDKCNNWSYICTKKKTLCLFAQTDDKPELQRVYLRILIKMDKAKQKRRSVQGYVNRNVV